MKRHLFILGLAFATTLGCQSKEKGVEVKFRVLPKTMPESGQVYITGNDVQLGEWQPDSIALEKQPDGAWTKTFRFEKGILLEYKITRGSWDTEAVSDEGIVPPDSRLSVEKDTTITIIIENWKDNRHVVEGQITRTVKYHRSLKGEGIRARDVIVWLPPNYDSNPEKRYPVLYMHDGQNLFDPRTAYIQVDWQVDEVADSLIQADEMQEIIVVGIYNTADRVAEYSDTKKGRAYMNFVINELKPLIDATYRTLPDRKNTAVMGSSMGGLISFLLVWQHSDIFSMAGCLSPAFTGPYRSAVNMVKTYDGPDKNIRIYMDNGELGLEERLQPGCEAMLAALQNNGFELGENLAWFLDEGAEHSERAWARRVWRPLLFMFGKN